MKPAAIQAHWSGERHEHKGGRSGMGWDRVE